MTLDSIRKRKSDSPSPKGKTPISIENLVVWTYRAQQAEAMARAIDHGPGEVRSQLASFAAVGGRVDGGGAWAGRGQLHDDALTVHEAVAWLGRETSALVRMHGRMATRPDPRIGARHRLEPAEWLLEEAAHDPAVMLRVPVAELHKTPRGRVWWVPVREVDRPGEVAADRARWTMWVDGLAQVRDAVRDRLTRHVVENVLPPALPWG